MAFNLAFNLFIAICFIQQSLSVTADHDPLLGLPLTPTKQQAFQDCDDEAGTSQISPAQLSSNKLKKYGAI